MQHISSNFFSKQGRSLIVLMNFQKKLNVIAHWSKLQYYKEKQVYQKSCVQGGWNKMQI